MTPASKADVATIARKLWGKNEADRREGRWTVRAVLDCYAKMCNHREAEQNADVVKLREALANAQVLEVYSGKDGHRQWADHAQTWLYPGDRVVVINSK